MPALCRGVKAVLSAVRFVGGGSLTKYECPSFGRISR
jgi:hypothetical protein